MNFDARGRSWPRSASLACATGLAAPLGACKDQAKESAAHAAPDAAVLADLVAKDVGEIERGLPEGAAKLAPLVAGGADPRQDIAGVRRALVRVRREVIDLNVGKSTFFALTDPSGVAIRNDLEEDVMAGQNLLALFPALAKAKDGLRHRHRAPSRPRRRAALPTRTGLPALR